jgi:acetyl esterase/lipase
MQDEIVARLAGALNAELVAAEARRAEQAPNPDSMDLYFQGMAWLNKRPTAPEFVIFTGLSFEVLRTRYNLSKSPDLHF